MVPARSSFKGETLALAPGLLARAVRREPDALAAFFEHYYDRVFAHVVNMLRDRARAADLTQEIFLRLLRSIERLDPERDPTGWVFTVASNLVRDHWRSAEHKRGEKEVDADDAASVALPHPDPDVQSVMEKDEQLRAVWTALHELSESDREIILLRDYEELSVADVARTLDLKEDAVRQRHSRAVARLGKRFHARANAERRDS